MSTRPRLPVASGRIARGAMVGAAGVLVVGMSPALGAVTAGTTTSSAQDPSAGSARSVDVGDDYALGIDDEGWVVGWSVPDDPVHPYQSRPHAVIWLPKGSGMIDLASYPPTAEFSLGLGIEAGRAVGDDVDGPLGSSARADYAALWNTRTGEHVDLSAGSDSSARDVNANGQVVGWVHNRYGYERACIWRAGSHKRVLLGTLQGDRSRAYANNDLGQVVGYSTTARSRTKAFVWDPRTQDMAPLGGFPRGTEWVVASDINDAGQVVGSYASASGATRAFLWHPRTRSVTDLGTLGSGSSAAEAINEDGTVVGTATRPSGRTRAFMWSTGTQRMVAIPGVPTNSAAYDVNSRGQVVGTYVAKVGVAQYPSAFLWRPRTQTMVTLPTLMLP